MTLHLWKPSCFNVTTPSYFSGVTLRYNTRSGHLLALAAEDDDLVERIIALAGGVSGSDGTHLEGAAATRTWFRTLRDRGFLVRKSFDERLAVREGYWR